MSELMIQVTASAGPHAGESAWICIDDMDEHDITAEIQDTLFDGEDDNADWDVTETDGFGDILSGKTGLKLWSGILEVLEVQNELNYSGFEAFMAYAEQVVMGGKMPSAGDFRDLFLGVYDDAAHFGREYYEDEVPDFLAHYVDYDRLGEDMLMNYNTAELPNGDIAVFAA